MRIFKHREVVTHGTAVKLFVNRTIIHEVVVRDNVFVRNASKAIDSCLFLCIVLSPVFRHARTATGFTTTHTTLRSWLVELELSLK